MVDHWWWWWRNQKYAQTEIEIEKEHDWQLKFNKNHNNILINRILLSWQQINVVGRNGSWTVGLSFDRIYFWYLVRAHKIVMRVRTLSTHNQRTPNFCWFLWMIHVCMNDAMRLFFIFHFLFFFSFLRLRACIH